MDLAFCNKDGLFVAAYYCGYGMEWSGVIGGLAWWVGPMGSHFGRVLCWGFLILEDGWAVEVLGRLCGRFPTAWCCSGSWEELSKESPTIGERWVASVVVQRRHAGGYGGPAVAGEQDLS